MSKDTETKDVETTPGESDTDLALEALIEKAVKKLLGMMPAARLVFSDDPKGSFTILPDDRSSSYYQNACLFVALPGKTTLAMTALRQGSVITEDDYISYLCGGQLPKELEEIETSAEAQQGILECLAAVERAREKMRADQVEIDELRAETRALIEQLKTA